MHVAYLTAVFIILSFFVVVIIAVSQVEKVYFALGGPAVWCAAKPKNLPNHSAMELEAFH
jgi:Na+-transporting methylmalonyl-CoA/oxaloacetate decarboxylase gamma subunit